MSRFHSHDDDRYVIVERHDSGISHFLLGAALGACAALLLAPKSGEETRRDIRNRALRVRRAAERAVQDATDTVTETFDDARRRVEDRIDAVRDEVNVRRQQVHRAMEAGRTAARDARVELEGRIAQTKAAYDAGAEVARTTRTARTPRSANVSAPDSDTQG